MVKYKKILEAFLVIVLVLFSFYYTDKVVSILEENDPIMKKINEEKGLFLGNSGRNSIRPCASGRGGNRHGFRRVPVETWETCPPEGWHHYRGGAGYAGKDETAFRRLSDRSQTAVRADGQLLDRGERE